MRWVKMAAVAATLGLGCPAACRADFQWVGDWQYSTSGTGTAIPGDPSADAASGQATASVDYDPQNPDLPTSQDADISFSRTFQVSGSPGGWAIDLTADTGYNLELDAHHGLAKFTIDAFAPAVDPSQYLISVTQNPGGFGGIPWMTAIVADGTYTVYGDFHMHAELDPQPYLGDSGSAYASGSAFTLTVDARAVPEPASAVLIACGAIGLAMRARRRARPAVARPDDHLA